MEKGETRKEKKRKNGWNFCDDHLFFFFFLFLSFFLIFLYFFLIDPCEWMRIELGC
jgi:hypothetical protein